MRTYVCTIIKTWSFSLLRQETVQTVTYVLQRVVVIFALVIVVTTAIDIVQRIAESEHNVA